jgi:hypothetical protein
MKMVGVIITTVTEHVLVDMGDQEIPTSEFGELFMKVAMTLSPRTVIAKSVQFLPVAECVPSEAARMGVTSSCADPQTDGGGEG